MMKFKECEFEFAVEAERKADGGLHVWVLNFGGGIKHAESNKVKVKYVALDGPPEEGETVAEVRGREGTRPKPRRHGRKQVT